MDQDGWMLYVSTYHVIAQLKITKLVIRLIMFHLLC